MGRKFLGGFGLLASILAGAGVAGAADLAVKAPVYKAPPLIVSDWAGFYLGVHGGYGWGDTKFDSPFEIANASPTCLSGPTHHQLKAMFAATANVAKITGDLESLIE